MFEELHQLAFPVIGFCREHGGRRDPEQGDTKGQEITLAHNRSQSEVDGSFFPLNQAEHGFRTVEG